MPTLETIRRLTIEGRTTGVKEATADLTALGRAQTSVAQSADGMAVATDSSSRRQLSAAKSYDNLRMRVDDAYRTQQRFQKDQAIVQRAFDQGSISVEEQASTLSMLSQKYGLASTAANENTKQNELSRNQLLMFGHSAKATFEQLAAGAPVTTILAQQGAEVAQAFSMGADGAGGTLKAIGSTLSGLISPATLFFGTLTAGALAAGAALLSYLNSEQKVQTSLLGSGRASGQSVSSINSIAQSASSSTGLSVSEARAFAAELASTGKIGRDNLEPLVKIGHDIATVYGIDATEAAKMLGKAYADPVQGADQLNDRLGFLDAAMQRQIQNLVAQNRVWEAQRVLQAGVESSLVGVGDAVSTTTKFWTTLGNAASSAWDAIGAGLARATGIGLKLGLDEQVAIAQSRLDSFKKDLQTAQEYAKSLGPDAKGVDTGYDAAIAGVQKYSAEVEKLTATMKRNADATVDAQQRQFSFAQAAAVRSQLPEIDQTQKLRNENELLVRTMIDVQTSGGAASPILQAMGRTYEELAQAVAKSSSGLQNFKTEFQQATEAQALQAKSLTAFSPSAKGDVAYQQRLNAELARGTELTKAQTLAAGDQAIAIKGVQVSLSEAARARDLASQQSVQSAQLEIDLLGKTIGQQAEMRANLQARQALEQQASQNRTGFDNAEYERLKKINAELGQRTQMAALAAVNDNISFGRQTALLSPDDVSIAQQLKSIYPDVAAGLASVEAQGLRVNNALRDISDTARDISRSFVTDFRNAIQSGSSAFDALSAAGANALNKIADKLTSMAIDSLWSKAFGGASGGLFSLFGLGGASSAGTGLSLTATGGLFADGGYTGAGSKYQPAGIVHAGEYVFSQASVSRIGLRNLDRLHRGYADGGPVMPMPMAARNDNSAQPMVFNYSPTINAPNSDAQAVAALAKVQANERRDFEKNVMAILAKARANKPGFAA